MDNVTKALIIAGGMLIALWLPLYLYIYLLHMAIMRKNV